MLNKYKAFYTVIDITDSLEEQQEQLDDMMARVDDFQIDNSIRITNYVQSESLYKNKCHITITIEYILLEDLKTSEILN